MISLINSDDRIKQKQILEQQRILQNEEDIRKAEETKRRLLQYQQYQPQSLFDRVQRPVTPPSKFKLHFGTK